MPYGSGGAVAVKYGTVNKVGNQSIPGGIDTKVTFGNVVQNPNGLWNAANNRFILNQTGIWLVCGNIAVSGDSSGIGIDWFCYIYKNGAALAGAQFRDGSGESFYGPYINIGFAFPVPVTAVTDYVEIFVNHPSVGAEIAYLSSVFSVIYEGAL
ncbi:hypothetical protein C4587_01895 [Candidatus Parcubacteria bacterium]|nr:MAG: hypothetical protein C4587_01895 [Candidatus Parcubacteria bacterium]